MHKSSDKFLISVFLSALAWYPAFASEAVIRLVGYSSQQVHDLELETQRATPLSVIGVGQPVYMKSEHEGTYSWSLTAPDGSATALSSSNEREIHFIPDMVGSYVVTFDYTDSEGASSSDEITITGANYVGISNCSMCHSGMIGNNAVTWAETGHADMFERGLNGEAHYSPGGTSCLECHTVGYDTLAVNGGFDDVALEEGWVFPDTFYAGAYDEFVASYPKTANLGNIQCESCHGPGSAHNGNPATIAVSYDAGVCAYCHYEETHHVYPNEWQHSAHGQYKEVDEHYNRASSGCAACHTAEGFFEINVSDDHSSTAPYSQLHGITCQVCHDPHDATGDHQLRIVEDYYYTSESGESKYKTDGTAATACDVCHHLREGTEVPGAVPHHNHQTDMLNNAVGYKNPAKTFPETNPHNEMIEGRCVGCHMSATPEGKYPYVGEHTFSMHAAADPVNGPEEDIYMTEACAGCHSDIGEDFDYKGIQTKVKLMLNELESRLPVARLGRLAGTVPAYDQEEVDSSYITVDQMNAAYNYFIVDYDGSYGVHNPKLAVALLESALETLPLPESCLACDVNSDGKHGIADVIGLLLIAKRDPGNQCLDRNRDGVYDSKDVVSLIKQIFNKTCPAVGGSSMLASVDEDDFFAGLQNLSQEEIAYIEGILARLELTEEQQAAFRVALHGHAPAASLPKAFALAQNAPNPFNPATTISYSVPDGASLPVSLAVYDIRGKLVRTLISDVKNAGTYTVFWDGTDESGVKVSSGVYLYRMRAGSFVQTRKMVLLK